MLTQDRLKEVIRYDPESGILSWKKKIANCTKVGTEAGCLNQNGYREIKIDGTGYKSHRLAWLYVHGYFHEKFIDHIDRNRSNNKISNLREVSQSCNMKNSSLYCTNKSGVAGVYWNNRILKWHARIINQDGKRMHLGFFPQLRDAVKARYEAELKYGYPECSIMSSAKLFLSKEVEICRG